MDNDNTPLVDFECRDRRGGCRQRYQTKIICKTPYRKNIAQNGVYFCLTEHILREKIYERIVINNDRVQQDNDQVQQDNDRAQQDNDRAQQDNDRVLQDNNHSNNESDNDHDSNISEDEHVEYRVKNGKILNKYMRLKIKIHNTNNIRDLWQHLNVLGKNKLITKKRNCLNIIETIEIINYDQSHDMNDYSSDDDDNEYQRRRNKLLLNLEFLKLEMLPNLKYVVFEGFEFNEIDIANLPTIEYMEFNYCNIAHIKNLPINLKKLNLGYYNKIRSISNLPHMINELEVKDKYDNIDELLNLIINCRTLTNIELSYENGKLEHLLLNKIRNLINK